MLPNLYCESLCLRTQEKVEENLHPKALFHTGFVMMPSARQWEDFQENFLSCEIAQENMLSFYKFL